MENKYDTLKDNQYNGGVNIIFNNFPENKPYTFLEIGCNIGYNLKALKQKYPDCYNIGIDILDVKPYEEVDEFYTLDITKEDIPIKEKSCDFILFFDVLEHLTKPDEIINKLRKYLKDDGYIVASIPNVMHYTILQNLLIDGNFTYTETGLLDYDHKHLFTYNEIWRLFNSLGFEFEYV